MRLKQAATNYNVHSNTIIEFLATKGQAVLNDLNTKISNDQLAMLDKQFKSSFLEKREADIKHLNSKPLQDNVVIEATKIAKIDKSKDIFKTVVKEVPQEIIKVVSKEISKETTKEILKEIPKEIIKETPKEVVKEATKEATKEAIKEVPKKVTKEKEKVAETEIPLEKVKEIAKNKAKEISKLITDKTDNISKKPTTKTKEVTKDITKEIPKEIAPKAEVTPKEEVKTSLPGLTILGKIDLSNTVITDNSRGRGRGGRNKPTNTTKTTNAYKDKKDEKKPETKGNLNQKIVKKETEKEPIKEVKKVVSNDTSLQIPKEVSNEIKKPISEVKTVSDATTTVVTPVATTVVTPTVEAKPVEFIELIKAKADALGGLTILGKIELPDNKRGNGNKTPVGTNDPTKKRKRNRIRKRKPVDETKPTIGTTGTITNNANKTTTGTNNVNKTTTGNNQNRTTTGTNNQNRTTTGTNNQNRNTTNTTNNNNKKVVNKSGKEEVSDKQIQDQIKATMARISGGGSNVKKKSVKKVLRDRISQDTENEGENLIKVTEFISTADLASLMDVNIMDMISKCLSLGMFVSINQRLDASAITIIADEFGYKVEFTSAEEEIEVQLGEEDAPESLLERPPIVTVMGHVDHGKTSLLDYIRGTKVAAKESGGITQHVGAYSITTEAGKKITFLDTPGHEAFTAMRARGAQVTDIVIIVIAADDNVMPQTKEAINHAQAAGVPIIIAINKVDKQTADPEKIRQELASLNVLVESWGGKYQDQEISAKSGIGIDKLLDKILLESELLELKANPKKKAVGTVIEASLDKGRGYLTNVLIQAGTMKVGDIILAGSHYGRVKAMTDHKGQIIKVATPSTPVQMLGLSGAPQAGDKVHVMETEREAREIANKRQQILREQSIRTTKRLTLTDIGRRLALGSFQQLNIIIKGDVDGSVEALSDSLLKLSTPEVQVNVVHKAVGQISESDVNLAAASDAIIIGFQVRPSVNAKKLAEAEEIEVRLYSIIYDAINEVKDAMEGMLAPTFEEIIVGNVEIREIFKISKLGTIAGSYVLDGYIKRNSKLRVIRDFVVIFTGEIDALKRFKDDVSEVKYGYEFGLSLKGFNDIEIGDNIEVFEQREVKRKLS